MVERGVIQVMEGRHCFAHLTIEDNLMTGAYTRKDGKAAVAQTLEKVYTYFPRLKTRRTLAGRLHLGRRAADVRHRPRADGQPEDGAARRAQMGLAPQIVEEVFEIVKDLNQREKVTFLLAEQNTNMALRYADYGYILENGRIVMDGAGQGAARERGREGVLPRHGRRRPQELQGRQELQAPQALAVRERPRRRRSASRRRRSEPDDALVQLKRQLRDLGLAERGKALRAARQARASNSRSMARRCQAEARAPARAAAPEWDRVTLKSRRRRSASFVDEVKKRLARWER